MYPGSIPSYAGFTGSHTLSADTHAAQHNAEQADISALATKLGTGASTPASGLVLRSSATGASVWGQVILTSDVSGVLPVANGGLGQASLSGLTLPAAILSGSPTLTTPVIANFTNSTHTHASNSQGGQLNGSNAITANSIFSTILGLSNSLDPTNGVQSYVNGGTAGGTFYYINLGGIKMLWGITNSVAGGVSASYGINLPASFFNTIQSGSATAGKFGSDFSCKSGFNTGQPTTTTADIVMISPGGDTASAFVWVVGT